MKAVRTLAYLIGIPIFIVTVVMVVLIAIVSLIVGGAIAALTGRRPAFRVRTGWVGTGQTFPQRRPAMRDVTPRANGELAHGTEQNEFTP